jgi:hypothetical protein
MTYSSYQSSPSSCPYLWHTVFPHPTNRWSCLLTLLVDGSGEQKLAVVQQQQQQRVGGAAASDVGVWWRRTLKAAIEAEMAAAANIILPFSSVILVGSIFA